MRHSCIFRETLGLTTHEIRGTQSYLEAAIADLKGKLPQIPSSLKVAKQRLLEINKHLDAFYAECKLKEEV